MTNPNPVLCGTGTSHVQLELLNSASLAAGGQSVLHLESGVLGTWGTGRGRGAVPPADPADEPFLPRCQQGAAEAGGAGAGPGTRQRVSWAGPGRAGPGLSLSVPPGVCGVLVRHPLLVSGQGGVALRGLGVLHGFLPAGGPRTPSRRLL